MAHDQDARTEPPTPRRRREARAGGQVPKSQDLAAAVLLMGGLAMLRLLGPGIWTRMVAICKRALAAEGFGDRSELIPLAIASAVETFRMVIPFMGILALLAAVVQYMQVGFLWTLKPLTPDLKKLNPITGLGRIFSARSMVMMLMNLGKLVLVVAAAYLVAKGVAARILYSLSLDQAAIPVVAGQVVFRVGMALGLVLLVLALLDYAYQRYRHEKDLKMTKEEVKDEMRSMEGDPVVKRRRREVQLQIAFQRLRQDVPQADVVVTNPTHVAVALRYDAETMAAPKVVAKGADYVALRIRQIAAASGVPILERPPLARSLFEAVEVGREVPERFYRAIAEVLAYVYELTGRRLGPEPVPVG